MIVLLVNDDGIESPGLKAMEDCLTGDHEVWVVAPEYEMSVTSHSITMKAPVRFREIGVRKYACDGTPADCVLYSLLGAIEVKPDVIISGINLGPNLGTDIIYSGTAAAARQGALMGYPSIAVSIYSYRPPFHFSVGTAFIKRNLPVFIKNWNPDHFLNINIPNSAEVDESVEITYPSKRIYLDHVTHFKAPRGGTYYFLDGPVPEAHPEEGSDSDAVLRNRISVCPVYLHPLNHTCESIYKESNLR